MRNQGIIFVLFICCSACQPTHLAPNPQENDQWVYRYKEYNEGGNVTDSSDISFTAVGFERGKNTIEPWIHMKRSDVDISQSFPLIPYGDFRMRSDGLYFISDASLGGIDRMILKYPASSGEVYEVKSSGNYHFADITIASVNDAVTVPDGFYSNLYTYAFNYNGGSTANLWFSDSAWFVKYEHMDSLSTGTGMYLDYSYELVDYTPQ
jgi:hypothetical protein